MKFRFSLEKLLEHLERQEKEAERSYLLARNHVDDANAELTELHAAVDRARRRASDLRNSGGECAASLQETDFFIAGQEVRIARQKVKIRELVSVMEEKHASLVEAAREKKKVARLREKMQERHKDLLKRKEAKDLDEIVTVRFGRSVE